MPGHGRKVDAPAVTGPGVYVHVPFCAQRCGYCDFNVLVGADEELRRRYVAALHAELRSLGAQGPAHVAPPGSEAGTDWPVFGSVFVGGGTPTQLGARELAGVLSVVRESLPVPDDAEITVEANPEDLDPAYTDALVAAGLTRLSIGAQSVSPHVLGFLDRRHDPDAPWRAVEAARVTGVSSISVDLIYGAPAETEADWLAGLEAAVAAGVDHVSCYSLTLEPNTPYAREVASGGKAAPDDDVAADRMATADARLSRAGFVRYEISNWAQPGHESRHNRTYWAGGNYLGVGAGAHGHWSGRRWWNLRPTHRYIEAVRAGRAPLGDDELLTPEQRRFERLLLGLRTTAGVDRDAVDPLDEAELARLAEAGFIEADETRVRLTATGRPLADAVTLRLTA